MGRERWPGVAGIRTVLEYIWRAQLLAATSHAQPPLLRPCHFATSKFIVPTPTTVETTVYRELMRYPQASYDRHDGDLARDKQKTLSLRGHRHIWRGRPRSSS